ncbi:pentapeptide repeat-containing protein [Lujinxingia vulgaris]|uniref:Pentapeptide repeat-containing protein n=2 Tax=Lujinxingia vulgaris TaxID=2600176 RepID=A0A5C6WTI6_9DELT|nr:pentapeptide repeat-containing protein [Lujinxingia vulgaris]
MSAVATAPACNLALGACTPPRLCLSCRASSRRPTSPVPFCVVSTQQSPPLEASFMSDNLASLIRSANPQAFHSALRSRQERDASSPISLEAQTFRELTLTGFDFSELDLTNCAFENCTLSEVRFKDAILDGAFFEGVTLLHCHFEGGSYEGWALDASTLSRCSFDQVVIGDNEWTDCRLNECELEGLAAQDWMMERVTFKGGRWQNVSIEGGDWSHVTLRELIVDATTITDVDAKNCYHVEVALRGTELPEGFLEKSGRRKAL